MYPIAAIAGDALKISPRETSVAIMLGASAGFVNPFSYQCNLMVYSAGNYKTREFARIGAPFQLWLMVVAGKTSRTAGGCVVRRVGVPFSTTYTIS